MRVRHGPAAAVSLLLFWAGSSAAGMDSLRAPDTPCSNASPVSLHWMALGLAAPQLPLGIVPPAEFIVFRLILDPVRPGRLWAATSYGLLRSDDAGISWRLVLRGADGALTVAVDPQSPANVLASDSQSISRSVDGGDSWTTTAHAHLVWALAFDSANSSVVYAGASYAYFGLGWSDPGRVYSSTDSGTTWTEPDPDFQPRGVKGLDIDLAGAGTLLAATGAGIFRSRDRGHSWEQAGGSAFGETGIAVGPGGSGIFVSTASNGYFDETTVGTVLHSFDEGSHFDQIFNGPGLTSVAIDPVAPLNVYAGGRGSVVHSQDGGTTWIPLNEGLAGSLVTTLAIDPRSGSVFAGTRSGLVFKLPLQRDRVSECRLPRAIAPRH